MKKTMLTNEQIGSICMALAHLLHAGIGPADALVLLAQDETDQWCRQMLTHMARQADDGMTLSVAFRQAACFPAYVCTLVEVGQRVGRLEQTLQSLADYYRDRAVMAQRVRTAVLYPTVLLAVLLAVLVVLLVWVLPIFNDVYAQLGTGLTGLAGGLLGFGRALGKALPYLAGVLILCGAAALIPRIRNAIKNVFLRTAGDKGVLASVNAARFVQALSLGRSSGMTDQEAVLLATTLAQVPGFQKRCHTCLARLEEGASVHQALQQAQLLPPAECRLLDAGVRSGRAETVLEDIAERMLDTAEEELEREVGKIEPAMVAVSCLLIGLVIASVMLPLIHIMSAIG